MPRGPGLENSILAHGAPKRSFKFCARWDVRNRKRGTEGAVERGEVLWFAEDVGRSGSQGGDRRVDSNMCDFQVGTEQHV